MSTNKPEPITEDISARWTRFYESLEELDDNGRDLMDRFGETMPLEVLERGVSILHELEARYIAACILIERRGDGHYDENRAALHFALNHQSK